jgi:hypothetical protein
MPSEHDTSGGGPNLTRQDLSPQARSHIANGRRHSLADAHAVNLGALPEPSQVDQSVDLERAKWCRVKSYAARWRAS